MRYLKGIYCLLSVFVIGCVVGWLVGLSYSPITSGVVTSIIAILTAVILMKRNNEESKAKNYFEAPYILSLLLFFSVGVSTFATLGMLARDDGKLVVFDKEFKLVSFLFDSSNRVSEKDGEDRRGRLYSSSIETDVCEDLLYYPEKLPEALDSYGEPWSKVNDFPNERRKEIVELICKFI